MREQITKNKSFRALPALHALLRRRISSIRLRDNLLPTDCRSSVPQLFTPRLYLPSTGGKISLIKKHPHLELYHFARLKRNIFDYLHAHWQKFTDIYFVGVAIKWKGCKGDRFCLNLDDVRNVLNAVLFELISAYRWKLLVLRLR
jgi:hypothetical protein